MATNSSGLWQQFIQPLLQCKTSFTQMTLLTCVAAPSHYMLGSACSQVCACVCVCVCVCGVCVRASGSMHARTQRAGGLGLSAAYKTQAAALCITGLSRNS